MDGACFVTIDFKETPFQLIFDYTYELGKNSKLFSKKKGRIITFRRLSFSTRTGISKLQKRIIHKLFVFFI